MEKLSLLLIIIFGAISALTPLAIDMYLPAMPTIANEFAVNPGAIQLTLTTYTIGFALGQLFNGPLADSFGRKPVLIIGIILFAAASIISAITHHIETLTWVRAAQGFAGAAAAIVVPAMVRDMFSKENFARTMSFIILVMTIAPLVAPLIGSYMTVWFGWRSVFWLLAIIALIVVFASSLAIPETLSPEKKQPFNLYNISRNYWGLLSQPQSIAFILTGAFSFSGMFAFLTAGSFIYIHIYQVEVQHVGYLFGLNIVLMMLMTSLNGRFVKMQGSHWMLRFGLNIQLFAAALLILTQQFDLGLWGTVIPIMIFVSTIPVIGSNSMALLLSQHSQMAGTAASLAGTLRFGTGALIAAIVAMLPAASVWPMVATMTICTILANFVYWFFAPNPTK